MESRHNYDGGLDRLNRMDDNDNDASMATLNDNDDDPILTATITFDVTVDPTGQVISTSEGQIVTESVVQNAIDGRLTTLSDHHQAMALAAVNAAAIAAAANEQQARGANMQADSLSSMNSASQHKEITATLHDSLDDDHDSDNDDTSSTSTESLIERSKKYMDKEAGIIILKRDNMPQNNFNINLDFGIRPNATPAEASRHAASTQDSRSIATDALNKNFNINVDFGLRPTGPDNNSYMDKKGVSGDYRYNQISELVQKVAQNQSDRDHIATVTQANAPVQQVVVDSASLPLLQACQTVDFDDLTRGFTPEENSEGKLVLYITEAQLMQLLKQRAIVVPNKKKLIVEDVEKKKLSLIDEANRKSPYREVELVVKKKQYEADDYQKVPTYNQNVDQNRAYQQAPYNQSVYDSQFNQQQSVYATTHSHIPSAYEYHDMSSSNNAQQQSSYNQSQTRIADDSNSGNNTNEIRYSTTNINITNYEFKPGQEMIGTAYNGVKQLNQNVAQLRDGKVISYKDFDLLVPSDRYKKQLVNGVDPTLSHYDYIQIGSDGTTTSNLNKSNSQVYMPKSYDFLNSKDYTRIKSTSVIVNQPQQQQQRPSQQYNYQTQRKIDEDQALRELDKFLSKLFTNLDREGKTIDWNNVQKEYRGDNRACADLMNNYVKSLIGSQPQSPSALKLLGEFVDRVLEDDAKKNYRSTSTVDMSRKLTDKDSLELIDDLIRRLRDSISNWKTIKRPVGEDRRYNVTTRQVDAFESTYSSGGANGSLKRKVTYCLDDFVPSTRVYEILDVENTDPNATRVFDIFGNNNNLNYIKPLDPNISDSISKPSVNQINKYLSVINTGLKNTDLVQIHPLLNNDTKISTQQVPQSLNVYPSLTEPVIIDSHDYEKYVEEVSKHFGGLQIIDFPLYVQGLEFRQNDPSNPNENTAQSFISSKPQKKAATESATSMNMGTSGIQKTGDRVLQPNDLYTKQVVNNVNNIQYVRVNGGPQLVAAQ